LRLRLVPVELIHLGYVPWRAGLGFSVPKVDPSFKVVKDQSVITVEARAMCTSLGCHVDGASNFWPDITSADGAKLGVMKRIATDMPDPDPSLAIEFVEFSKALIDECMEGCILEPDIDLSVPRWLELSNYPAYRKVELLKIWDDYVGWLDRFGHVNSHIKFESYVTAKFFRGIYSRTDVFKCLFGPMCAEIGRRFFVLAWFVKYLTQDEKKDRLVELFNNPMFKIFSNDFTSFEATFKPWLMEIELYFYRYCMKHVPDMHGALVIMEKYKKGLNHLKFKSFSCVLRAKRYSGEMDTSLSNGLVNWCFMCFLLHKSGHPREFYVSQVPPQIEGDDCLGAFLYPVDGTILLKLGAKAKLEIFDNFNEASFCGMVFSSLDDGILRDPISAILDFGWADMRYIGCSIKTRKLLIRAKSLSLLYMYPNCPVLSSLAGYGLRVTRGYSDLYSLQRLLVKTTDAYKRHKIWLIIQNLRTLCVDYSVSPDSREIVERKFLVPVEAQLAIEKYLDSLMSIQPLDLDLLRELAGQDRCKNFEQNVGPRTDVRKLLAKNVNSVMLA